MAAHASAAKQPAAPESMTPAPAPTIQMPPQSSVTPEPELTPPQIDQPPKPLQNVPSPSKSLAPSKLMPDEVPSDNDEHLLESEDVITIKKGKKKAPKTSWASTGKTKRHVMIEESDEDEEPARPTKGRPKRIAHKK
jgi:hypothetical protein